MLKEKIPDKYKWLYDEPAPRVLLEAISLFGVLEQPGSSDNEEILAWAGECKIKEYIHDSIAWCGLFAAVVVKRARYEFVKNPLWAANWLKFGTKVKAPMLGDILVFKRPGGSHVGFYVAEDSTHYHVLGGNQGDKVSIIRIDKTRLLGARRCPFAVGQPSNVRSIILDADGEVSQNEA